MAVSMPCMPKLLGAQLVQLSQPLLHLTPCMLQVLTGLLAATMSLNARQLQSQAHELWDAPPPMSQALLQQALLLPPPPLLKNRLLLLLLLLQPQGTLPRSLTASAETNSNTCRPTACHCKMILCAHTHGTALRPNSNNCRKYKPWLLCYSSYGIQHPTQASLSFFQLGPRLTRHQSLPLDNNTTTCVPACVPIQADSWCLLVLPLTSSLDCSSC